jgi:UDP-N-acetylglucosamine diphosphorylase / glucose-1-phosphate thymidylyltransferase / UDP-N-acetylgalactosamine diphosphorylase / glucosamine-1-phosphate N-acetyltransferase / galactosamine-1-phosphate N-acetyltransferase
MNFKLIMPMAGNGSRFSAAGYSDPKPLVDVRGKPMFVQAVDNIGLEFDEMIFIVQKSHNIRDRVLEYYPNAHVVEIDGITQGAACSVLLADPYISDEDAVFVSNCDQLIQWDTNDFKTKMDNDGIILTFDCPNRNPKWSFAQTDTIGRVVRVAEKDPISELATTGHYYWSHWITFKNSVNEMIQNNDRFNNEFYLCPTFNYTINHGGHVVTSHVTEMHGLGTPEDLQKWLDS